MRTMRALFPLSGTRWGRAPCCSRARPSAKSNGQINTWVENPCPWLRTQGTAAVRRCLRSLGYAKNLDQRRWFLVRPCPAISPCLPWPFAQHAPRKTSFQHCGCICAFVEEENRRRGSRTFTAPRGASDSGEAKGVAGIFALVIPSTSFCCSMEP